MGWELPLGTAHPQQYFVQNCGQPPAWGHKVLGPDSPVRGWRRFLPWSSFSSGAGVGIEPREIMGFLSHHPKLSCYTRRDSRLLCPNVLPWVSGPLVLGGQRTVAAAGGASASGRAPGFCTECVWLFCCESGPEVKMRNLVFFSAWSVPSWATFLCESSLPH